MHSKLRYKICICSVISGELESYPYKGLSIIFPKILYEIWRITKVKHFLILNEWYTLVSTGEPTSHSAIRIAREVALYSVVKPNL